MLEAIKQIDFIILYGHRLVEEQFELYKKGREQKDGGWIVVDKSKVVTNCDGTIKPSKHNAKPSLAIDIAPWPIDWENIGRFKTLAFVINNVAKQMKIEIRWGADWDRDGKPFEKGEYDSPHWELP